MTIQAIKNEIALWRWVSIIFAIAGIWCYFIVIPSTMVIVKDWKNINISKDMTYKEFNTKLNEIEILEDKVNVLRDSIMPSAYRGRQ